MGSQTGSSVGSAQGSSEGEGSGVGSHTGSSVGSTAGTVGSGVETWGGGVSTGSGVEGSGAGVGSAGGGVSGRVLSPPLEEPPSVPSPGISVWAEGKLPSVARAGRAVRLAATARAPKKTARRRLFFIAFPPAGWGILNINLL